MVAAPLVFAIVVLAVLAGVVIASVVAYAVAVKPARSTLLERTHALAEREAALTSERIALATARADAANAAERAEHVNAALEQTTRNLERAVARTSEIDAEAASLRATLAQIKVGEADVDARLQRIAAQYVTEAREVLIKAATERFNGDASVFREKLAASVAPLSERIDLLGRSLTDLGTARTQDRERVATLLEGLNTKMAGIDDATRRVERVLGNSQARGSWGEFELKRLLELTGMTEHVSFETQASGYGADATGRPDVVLRIPGDLTVPIDAKVPFVRYQEAVSTASELEREPLLDAAVAAIRAHVKVLATRRYHDAPSCIGWTIMFVPIEAMLATLFARDRDIFEVARESRVLIASPLTLMLYLEAFSRGWAAQKQSENATIILEEARVLVSRIANFTDKFGKAGSALSSAVDKYNDAVGTFELRIGPQARKIVALRGDAEDGSKLAEIPGRARIVDMTRFPAPLALEP